MINIANMLGRVMMTAVRFPRSHNDKYQAMRTYAEIEYRKGDQAYVLDCLSNRRPITGIQ